MQGIINAFDMPGRQSFMLQMVEDRRDLQNAIAINSSMVNMARLVGPSLAGMLIAVSSEGWCFLIDGISYIAVIASLIMMRLHAPVVARRVTSTFTDMKEGWTYVSGFLPIRTILLLFAVVSLMGMPFVVLMPIFAVRVLHGGPHTLGFLMGAMGVGALISALSLARRLRNPLRCPLGAAAGSNRFGRRFGNALSAVASKAARIHLAARTHGSLSGFRVHHRSGSPHCPGATSRKRHRAANWTATRRLSRARPLPRFQSRTERSAGFSARHPFQRHARDAAGRGS
jgi:MFS family permease